MALVHMGYLTLGVFRCLSVSASADLYFEDIYTVLLYC